MEVSKVRPEIILFIGNHDVDNIDDAILVLS